MANLRDAAAQVDWQQAQADALAIARKQIAFGRLPAARQDNLQLAHDVVAKLAQNESYYRTQTISRLDNYEKQKAEYVKYIKQRDEAALQGKLGSAGLMVIYTVDMVSNGLAAAGIPMAKFYTAVRSVGDKSVAAYESLRPYLTAPTVPRVADATSDNRGAIAVRPPAVPTVPATSSGAPANDVARGGNIPDVGFRVAHGLPAGANRTERQDEAAPVSPGVPSRFTATTAEENTRAVVRTLEAARELHKALDEAAGLDRSHPGINRFREWTKPQQDGEKHDGFSVSKGGGQIADTTFKTINSLTDLSTARRSGDTTRIYEAETKAVRDVLKTGSTMLEVLQKDRKLAGEHGPSGEFPVAAQFMKGFKTGDKIVGGTQSAVHALDAYYDARDGEFQKAWEHARDGATDAAKTFTRYGEQTEAAGKAVDDLIRYGKATDNRQRATSLMEFVGHGTKVGGVIPGASNAGEAILNAKDVVDQGFNLKEAYDLGHQDIFKPNLDRLSNEIMGDYELYTRLDEFKPLFNLPANQQPAVRPPAAQ